MWSQPEIVLQGSVSHPPDIGAAFLLIKQQGRHGESGKYRGHYSQGIRSLVLLG